MSETPPCPKCGSAFVYADGPVLICPECVHERATGAAAAPVEDAMGAIWDANATIPADGDAMTVIKDLKIKGSSQSVKVGTTLSNIRLAPGGGHNIDRRIHGIGQMSLKSEFVRRA
jgi:protein PhnA